MNSAQDPNLTAWALNELSPAERASIDEAMKKNPSILAEAQKTQSFCNFIQSQLCDETASLTESQRARLSSYVGWQPRVLESNSNAPVAVKKPAKPHWYHRPAFIIPLSAAAAVVIGTWPYWTRQLTPKTTGADYTQTYVANESTKPELKRSVLAPSPSHEPAVVMQTQQGASRMPVKLAADAAMRLERAPSEALNISIGQTEPGAARSGARLASFSPASASPAPDAITTLTINGGTTITFGNVTIGQGSSPITLTTNGGTVTVNTAPAGGFPPERSGGGSVNELEDIISPETTVSGSPLSSRSISGTLDGGVMPRTTDAPASATLAGLNLGKSAVLNVSLLPSNQHATAGNVTAPTASAPAQSDAAFPFAADATAYADVKRALNSGLRPRTDAITIAGMINAFAYESPTSGESPLAVSASVVEAPWDPAHRLARLTVKALDEASDVTLQLEFNPAAVRSCRLIGSDGEPLNRIGLAGVASTGKIPAGRTITALYEIIPADATNSASVMMNVKLSHKNPASAASTLVSLPVKDEATKFADSDREFQFATAVAGLGLLLRDSSNPGNLTWEQVRQLAVAAKGEDRSGQCGEFIQLIDKAHAVVGGDKR